MPNYKIAWLPGDGVGIDVSEATKIVLDKTGLKAEYIHGDIGWEFWCKEGNPLPDRTIDLLKNTDCAFFGAITSKPKEDSIKELAPELHSKRLVYFSPIVKMRQLLDLYICLRPCQAFPKNPLNYKENIDIVVFRENTEGMYIGVEYNPVPEVMYGLKGMEKIPKDAAISIRSVTKKGSERIIRAAFDYARKNKRKKVTVVNKANVLRATCGVFLDVAKQVAKDYPEIQFDNANIDAICMWLLKNPLSYEVIVTTNLFGDILSDLASQLVGGMGFACSGNIGEKYAVFEPTHGSAPKYAGLYKVNPIASILAAKMMLEWLGENAKADSVFNAVKEVVAEGKIRTYDMGGINTTIEMANAIANKI